MADSTPASQFVFADHLVLEDSPTREFYKSVLQGLIHKNNNIFGVIQGFASLVLMEDDVPPAIRDNVSQIRESAQGATDLARTFLTTAGCARVKPEAIKLQDLLLHMEATAKEICQNRNVPLRFHAQEDLPAVMADSNKLLEVIRELVKNAAEAAASVSGGEVALDILAPGDASPAEERRVDLFIRNSSSVDLTPEKIREAFTPFHGEKGNAHFGIGLTTAGVLAGQMKMRLGLRSADGTTTAWLSLPMAD